MPKSNDYQPNLSVVDIFPFTIYHNPIRNHVLEVIREEAGTNRSLQILNVGCGLSQILKYIDPRHGYTGVDVDERSLRTCRQRFPQARFEVCGPFELPFPDASFDVVFATEVIEHVLDPQRWLREVMRVLKPGGRLQLSTPNYGDFLLALVESTFLELVARLQGFTRKGIHPTPFSQNLLRTTLEQAGLEAIQVKKTFLWLALVASARKAAL
ncbi:MAG: methyltransferase domain-containing protein [Candidatus Eremiobacteraeota bacterium]|nr:methyltransferase domain-containing protein [Candidatus Eremiobacteraeota bacterium]MCW5870452.1 methyltransferase domain-containing protein [Candidatus Eremiobacteraeota bacterium]